MASASVKSFQVDITTSTLIKITPEPVASFIPEYISTKEIKSVTPIYYDYTAVENNDSGDQFQETYPYPTMTVLAITLIDDTILRWELQSITNQATWSNGTAADLAVAAAAIAALI